MANVWARLYDGGAQLASVPEPSAPCGVASLPALATEAEYAKTLARVLDGHFDPAVLELRAALAVLPEQTVEISFGIQPDQDSEGTFSVLIHLGGPDNFVLNKAIQAHRCLFDIRRIEGGMNVAVPMFDPDEVSYLVNDVIADTAADWVERLWAQAGQGHGALSVYIFCEDDHGDTPRWLQEAA